MYRRLLRALWFLLPCAAAAACAALAAGLAESGGAPGLRAIAVGYSSLLTWPVLTVAALVGRWTWAAWRRLFATTTAHPDGHLRFAGWFGAALLVLGGVAFLGFQIVRWLSAHTAFKPKVVAVVVPGTIACALAGLLVLTPVVVDALTAGLGAIERKRGRQMFTPGRVVVGTLVIGVGVAVLEWFVTISPTFGYIDLGVLIHPVVALVVLPAALVALLHAPRPVRVATTAVALVATLGSIGFALRARHVAPTSVLEVWARPSLAGDIIENLYDLEDLRQDIQFPIARPAPIPGATPHDVLLVTIDTTRADHVSAYGGSAAMPNLDGLAKRGALFERAYAPSNVTRRSIPSIATGVSPTRMRGKVAGWALRLDPRHILLAERFRAAGYQTAGFFCCESFWAPRWHLGLDRGMDSSFIDYDGAKLAAALSAFITRQGPLVNRKPWFVWIHFIEPHNWTQDSEIKVIERSARYDASLELVDGFLAGPLAALAARGDGGAVIAVTADHGEALGEHGEPYHSTDVYNAQIQIPLIIAGPAIPASVIHEPVGTISLAPTLLALGGLQPPGMPAMDGTDFSALATGARASQPNGGYAFSAMIADRSVPKPARALVIGQYKLIETGERYELYDVVADPHELHDLAATQPAKVVEMRSKLAARSTMDRTSPFVDIE